MSVQSFHDGKVVLHQGDCLEVMRTLPDNSIDSVVTDPPYFLTSISKRFGEENSAPAQYGNDGSFARLSGGFMQKRWDDPGAATGITTFEAWLAGFIAGEGCFRVQSHKDGKYYACSFSIHLRQDDTPILEACRDKIGGRLAFGDERTNKQGITSAPDVRWIVETIEGCLSLAKILDKVPLFAKKAADYSLWRRALHLWHTTPKGSRWHGPRDVVEMRFLHDQLQKVKRWEHGVDLSFDPFMRPDQFFHYRWTTEAMRVLKPGGFVAAFSSTRTYHRLACAAEDAGFAIHPMLAWVFSTGFPKAHRVAVEGYGGWRYGTQSLKPAFEPVLLCQKPFSESTGSENVARWGCGAINIDACRVEGGERPAREHTGRDGSIYGAGLEGSRAIGNTTLGRFPANLCHDGSDEVLAAFPDSKGQQGDVRGDEPSDCHSGVYSGPRGRQPFSKRNDSGSAARFFASFPQEPASRLFYSGKASADNRIGSKHPTIKPVGLMRWLVRLVTPPGGVVLDLFSGSGTTGEAALREGFRAILIEREAEYCADIAQRMEHAFSSSRERKTTIAKAKGLVADAGPLFAELSVEEVAS